MNTDLIELPAFNVQGIAARVSNDEAQAIAGLGSGGLAERASSGARDGGLRFR